MAASVAMVGVSGVQIARLRIFALVLPLALILIVFVVAVSVFRYGNFEVIPAFTLENCASVLQSHLTLSLYLTMLKLAALTWICTPLIGFSVAGFLVFHVRNRLAAIGLFLLCTVPFWTSNVIRMISSLPLLGKQGVINQVLMIILTIMVAAILQFVDVRKELASNR